MFIMQICDFDSGNGRKMANLVNADNFAAFWPLR